MIAIKRKYKSIIEVLFWTAVITTIKGIWKSSQVVKVAQRQYITGETLDFSGQYRVIRFYRFDGIPSNYSYQDVTLTTQCSVNHLHHLVDLTDTWNGPVSCSIFVPNEDASVASDAVTLLKKCFPKIKKHVSFHLVYPANHPADLTHVGEWLSLSCDELLEKLENYGYQNYMVGDLAFPHNVLRNAARTGVLSEFVFLVDIDTIPNRGLREKFIEFATKGDLFGTNTSDLIAYVVPVFEVKQGSASPIDKRQLLKGLIGETVRPFHNATCWWCHRAENVDKWIKIPQRFNNLNTAFEAEWDKSWEPFYIAKRIVPLFDERFKQYGFDRIQQICEMHVAGYKFVVLDNAFLTHQGWKYPGKFYANKEIDTAQNWILFNYHFKDELLIKYKTNRTCSPIEKLDINTRRGMPLPGRSRVIKNRFKRPFGVG